jgi:hypothetical protein
MRGRFFVFDPGFLIGQTSIGPVSTPAETGPIGV